MLSRAFRRAFAHPLQSLLIVVATALGMSVVTAMTAYVQSSREHLEAAKQALEFRQIIVFGGGAAAGNDLEQTEPLPQKIDLSSAPVVFSPADLEQIRAAAPSVDYAYMAPPAFRTQFFTLTSGTDIGVASVSRDYLGAAKLAVTGGEGFSEEDFRTRNPVMLVTTSGAGRLGLTGDPVGQICDTPVGSFTVIGVTPDPDEPLAEYDALVPEGILSVGDGALPATGLFFAVTDVEKLDRARAEVETFVRRTWKDDAQVYAKSLAELERTARSSVWVTAVFAAIGLVIAALNVMNLFVAQVVRQRRALAVRRALGATRRDVLATVLGEILLLGVLGGLLGVAAGAGLTAALNGYVQNVTAGAWPLLAFSASGAGLGFLCALALSLLFGLYPALFASRLDLSAVLGES